jgi:hypothetical protein
LLSSLMTCFEVGDLGLIFMDLTLPSDFVQHRWCCYPYFQSHGLCTVALLKVCMILECKEVP